MRLLAIIGSPRKKGDCVKVIKKVEEAMNKKTSITVDYLFLKDLKLDYCSGCMACITRGEELCPKKEITLELKERMENCDGLIFASPVYAHGVTALMKNFVDYFSYMFHRPVLVDKPALIITTTGGSGIKETLKYLKFTAIGFGCNIVGSLGVISSLSNHEKYQQKVEKQISILAENLLGRMNSGKVPSPSLYELMYFRGIRSKARMNPFDKIYWESKGWLDKSYFVDVPINPIKNAIAALSEALIGVMVKWYFKDMTNVS